MTTFHRAWGRKTRAELQKLHRERLQRARELRADARRTIYIVTLLAKSPTWQESTK